MATLRPLLSKARLRGITLLETMLALAVGAIVIVGSVQGINRYTEGVQTQAAANQLQRIIAAADTWANDHYEDIQGAGGRVYSVANTRTELAPYLGGSFPQDSYRNSYRLATRVYNYQVPDPATGANETRQAVQVLVVAFNDTANLPIRTEADLRVAIANTAGRGAGFVSTAIATCDNGTGGRLAAGNICGAFGSYALNASQFPSNALQNAVFLGMVTKGDSSFYGDQLYRYDYGDPDLNTMRTALLMDSRDDNEIQSPRRTLTLRAQTAAGGESSIILGRTSGGSAAQGDIVLRSGNSGRVVINSNDSARSPILRSNNNVLLMGDSATRSFQNTTGGTNTIEIGGGQVRATQLFAPLIGTEEVSSLWRRGDTPLRLQNFTRGEVIIGQRGRYSPNNQGAAVPGLNYELSDGRLIAGHVISQDITCADCGGSLSQILPRWRHMGTYFVGYTRGAGTRVNHPTCGDTRRNTQVRVATQTSQTGTDRHQAFQETTQDTRYRPAILLIPRQVRTKSLGDSEFPGKNGDFYDVPFDAHFRADQPVNGAGASLPYWNVILHKTEDNVYSTAFALTYCVFTGGGNNATDPTNTQVPGMFANTPTDMGTWTALP